MSSSSDNRNPDLQAARWYARRSNQTIGPMPTEEMVALIERGTLADYDVVRLDGTDEWQKVGEIHKLLMEPTEEASAQTPASPPSSEPVILDEPPSVASEPETPLGTPSSDETESSGPSGPDDDGHEASDAASEALAQMNVARLRHQESGEGRKRKRSQGGKPIATVFIQTLSAVLTWLLLRLAQALKLRSVQAGLAILLVAAIVWGVVLPRWPVDNREVYAQFTGLSEQIEMYRNTETTSFQWQKLEEKVVDTVNASRSRLEQQTSSMRPDLQELSAAAELFPDAVREAQSAADDRQVAASKLAIHLDNAERLIERRTELQAEMPQSEDSLATGNAMFWGMVAVDVALALAVLIWITRLVIRRTGSREASTAT